MKKGDKNIFKKMNEKGEKRKHEGDPANYYP